MHILLNQNIHFVRLHLQLVCRSQPPLSEDAWKDNIPLSPIMDISTNVRDLSPVVDFSREFPYNPSTSELEELSLYTLRKHLSPILSFQTGLFTPIFDYIFYVKVILKAYYQALEKGESSTRTSARLGIKSFRLAYFRDCMRNMEEELCLLKYLCSIELN